MALAFWMLLNTVVVVGFVALVLYAVLAELVPDGVAVLLTVLVAVVGIGWLPWRALHGTARLAARAVARRRGRTDPTVPVRVTELGGAAPEDVRRLVGRRAYLVVGAERLELWRVGPVRAVPAAAVDRATVRRATQLDHDPEHYRNAADRSIALVLADWTATLRVRHRVDPTAEVRLLHPRSRRPAADGPDPAVPSGAGWPVGLSWPAGVPEPPTPRRPVRGNRAAGAPSRRRRR